MLVWLSIYTFFNFLSELNSVGTSKYNILEAIKYIVLNIPEVAYEQAAAVILLGCILGMGHLVTTGQLLIFRVSGLSVLGASWIVVKNALVFIFLLIFIGEAFAPVLTKYAESERSIALGHTSLSNDNAGFWIKDGDNVINVKNNINGSLFSGINIFEVNKSNRIERVINSDSANFDGKSLNLNETDIFSITANNTFEKISLKERKSYNKSVAFDQDLIASLEKEPKDLSTYTIIKQIQFLTDNKLRAEVFEIELYERLVKPLALIAMILLAMLFIFGSNRDITLGRKIFFGVAIGLSFELISRIVGAMALSFNFSPLLSSFAPSALVIIIAITILTKKSKS
jgi:lipopolysaccharide export system permease protein